MFSGLMSRWMRPRSWMAARPAMNGSRMSGTASSSARRPRCDLRYEYTSPCGSPLQPRFSTRYALSIGADRCFRQLLICASVLGMAALGCAEVRQTRARCAQGSGTVAPHPAVLSPREPLATPAHRPPVSTRGGLPGQGNAARLALVLQMPRIAPMQMLGPEPPFGLVTSRTPPPKLRAHHTGTHSRARCTGRTRTVGSCQAYIPRNCGVAHTPPLHLISHNASEHCGLMHTNKALANAQRTVPIPTPGAHSSARYTYATVHTPLGALRGQRTKATNSAPAHRQLHVRTTLPIIHPRRQTQRQLPRALTHRALIHTSKPVACRSVPILTPGAHSSARYTYALSFHALYSPMMESCARSLCSRISRATWCKQHSYGGEAWLVTCGPACPKCRTQPPGTHRCCALRLCPPTSSSPGVALSR